MRPYTAIKGGEGGLLVQHTQTAETLLDHAKENWACLPNRGGEEGSERLG